jgi:hypothetical protein
LQEVLYDVSRPTHQGASTLAPEVFPDVSSTPPQSPAGAHPGVHHPNHRLALTPVYIHWIIAIGHEKIDKLILEIENETP